MLQVIQTDAVWQEMGRRFSIIPPMDWGQKIRMPFHFATKRKIHVSYNKQSVKNTPEIDNRKQRYIMFISRHDISLYLLS